MKKIKNLLLALLAAALCMALLDWLRRKGSVGIRYAGQPQRA